MKMQLNILGIILILAVVFGTFLLGKGFGRLDRDNQLQTANEALNSQLNTLKRYEITIDSLTEQVSQMNYVVIDDQRLITNLRLDNERLKKLNIVNVEVIAKLETSVKLLNKELVSASEPVIRIDSEGIAADGGIPKPKPCMELPMTYNYQDDWAYNNTYIGIDGQATFDFGLYPSNINLVLGEQKMGWLKKKEGVVAVTSPSPYLTIDPSQVVVVKPKKKFYQRNAVWLTGGLIVGFLLH
jgi:hypothetical protein